VIEADTVYRIRCDGCGKPLSQVPEWVDRAMVSELAQRGDWLIPYGGPHLCPGCREDR
jgi:hypothetical protein